MRRWVGWTCVAAAVALLGFVASPAAASPSVAAPSVVQETVRTCVVLTAVDDNTVEIRSNVPWSLSLETPTGPLSISGPAAPWATRVPLPPGSSYSLLPGE